MSEKMRAAVYCRLARTDDERIAEQENRVSSYAKKQGCGEIAVFVDNGENGNSLNRPAMNRLNADIEAGLIDAVYVHSLPRIGRNVIEVLKWLDGLRRKGIVVKAADGSIDEHSSNSFYDAYLESLCRLKKGGK